MRKIFLLALFVVIAGFAIAKGLWPLAALLLILGALRLYLYAFPNSRLIPVLYYWFGPYPHFGELQSTYLFRLAGFALVLFVVLVGLILVGVYSFPHYVKSPESHQVFMALFTFGLPLLAGMATLGALLCIVKAMWLRLTHTDSYFAGSSKDSLS
jgi:hypothetical protein